MPGPSSELVPNEDSLDKDGSGEGNKRCHRPDGEHGAYCHTPKHEQVKQHPDQRVEPNGVDRSQCSFVHLLEAGAQNAEAIVSGISEADAAGCHHAALAHRISTDDSQCKKGDGGLFWKNLQQVSRPGLSLITKY